MSNVLEQPAPTDLGTGQDVDIAHICRVHHTSEECDATNHDECRPYCTDEIEIGKDWAPEHVPICVVCLDMFKNDPDMKDVSV